MHSYYFTLIFILYTFCLFVQEVCYGEQILGLDVCLSGRYIKPVTPHAPVFPFCGPSKFNISIKPGKNPAQKIKLTVSIRWLTKLEHSGHYVILDQNYYLVYLIASIVSRPLNRSVVNIEPLHVWVGCGGGGGGGRLDIISK